MSRFFAIVSLALLFLLPALPARAVLPVGATASDFTAPASRAGESFTFSLAEARANGPVVVYFYPAAFTRGCDLEAHTFAENMDAFAAAGASVVGVSADSIDRLNDFSADPDYCAGKFPVASDPDGKIAATYGLAMTPPQPGVVDSRGQPVTHGFLPRTTFVIDHDGKVVATFSSKQDHLTPDQHVARSLAIVKDLHAGESR